MYPKSFGYCLPTYGFWDFEIVFFSFFFLGGNEIFSSKDCKLKLFIHEKGDKSKFVGNIRVFITLNLELCFYRFDCFNSVLRFTDYIITIRSVFLGSIPPQFHLPKKALFTIMEWKLVDTVVSATYGPCTVHFFQIICRGSSKKQPCFFSVHFSDIFFEKAILWDRFVDWSVD